MVKYKCSRNVTFRKVKRWLILNHTLLFMTILLWCLSYYGLMHILNLFVIIVMCFCTIYCFLHMYLIVRIMLDMALSGYRTIISLLMYQVYICAVWNCGILIYTWCDILVKQNAKPNQRKLSLLKYQLQYVFWTCFQKINKYLYFYYLFKIIYFLSLF